jgi:hypothetical protein
MDVEKRRAEYEAQAVDADNQAEQAKDPKHAADWRKIAAGYRSLAKHTGPSN